MTGSLFKELKRRKVFKVGAAYLVVAWLAVQGASIGFPAFDAPPWALRVFILVALLGFPVAVVLAWVFETTPDGLQFDPVRKGTKRVVGVGVLLVVIALGWYFKGQPAYRDDDVFARPGEKVLPIVDSLPPPPASEQSIAVLPFENLSADPDNAFFATGIQDEILTSLAKVGGLKVISRTSTIKYGAKPDNLQKIGRELGVAYILEGSVQRSGDTVRVNVQLIDARSDQHRWAETYDRPLANVFKVQSEVAETIAGELNTKLSSAEQAALAKPPTTNPRAYEHYLRGLALFLQTSSYSKEESSASIREFEAAVKEDPDFTLAWAYLATQDTWYYFTGFAPTKEQLEKAREALDRAEALDPTLKEVRVARSSYLYYGLQDFKGALAITRKLNVDFPNDGRSWYQTGLLSRRLGDFEGAIAAFVHARKLSPNDYAAISEYAVLLWTIQRYPEALRAFEPALDLNPGDPAMLGLKLHTLWATQGLRAGAEMLAALKVDSAAVSGLRAQQAEYERDDSRAEILYRKAIADYDSEQVSPAAFAGYVPLRVEWRLRLAGLLQRRGDPAGAAKLYREVMDESDKELRTAANPYVQAAWHAVRGLALAGLGRKVDAVAEGQRAVTLIPTSKDAFEGPYWPVYLSRIHAMNGEATPAVDLLRGLVAAQMGADPPGLLRVDPIWDPIRKDAGFGDLLRSP